MLHNTRNTQSFCIATVYHSYNRLLNFNRTGTSSSFSLVEFMEVCKLPNSKVYKPLTPHFKLTVVKCYLHETRLAPLRITLSRTATRSKPFHTILKSTLFLYKNGNFKKIDFKLIKFEATYKEAYLSTDTEEHEYSGITQIIFMTWVRVFWNNAKNIHGLSSTHTERVQLFAKDVQSSVSWQQR